MESSKYSQASEYLSADHRRIEELFLEAIETADGIDMASYDHFRSTLLRHIAIEEKIVLPLIRKHLPGGFPMEAQLRLEHGAIASLLAPPPEPPVLYAIQALLLRHNELEEAHGTLYDLLNDCVSRDDGDAVAAMLAYPEVPLSRHLNNPLALEPARRALLRAGYDMDMLVQEGMRAREETGE
jgi:hypothetical protein